MIDEQIEIRVRRAGLPVWAAKRLTALLNDSRFNVKFTISAEFPPSDMIPFKGSNIIATKRSISSEGLEVLGKALPEFYKILAGASIRKALDTIVDLRSDIKEAKVYIAPSSAVVIDSEGEIEKELDDIIEAINTIDRRLRCGRTFELYGLAEQQLTAK